MKELKKCTTLPIIMKGIHKCQTDIKMRRLKKSCRCSARTAWLTDWRSVRTLATVVIIVIASLIAGCYMVSHF